MRLACAGDMRFMITTSRMPCAIDEIRKLGSRGHHVVATDSFSSAPGNHSRHASIAYVTPSPRFEPARFVTEIVNIAKRERIDLVLPAFEEAFYLAKLGSKLPSQLRYFPPFDVLRTLHDKASFSELARSLGLRAPESVVVSNTSDLRAAIARHPRFFAKPVLSRGGVDLVTNAGVRAGLLSLDEVEPTVESPWIVQEFIDGDDLCCFSVVQHGVITAHVAYVHPREIEHAGGIVFESVDEPECLQIAQKIATATGYHGQLSLDLMKTKQGMVLIECNPRPTAGIHMMSAEMFEAALLDVEGRDLRIVEPGVRRKYTMALLRDMILHPDEAREDAKHLLGDAKEVVADPDDLLPSVYQVVSYSRVLAYRRSMATKSHKKTDLKAAYFADVCWNADSLAEQGEPASGRDRFEIQL